MFCSSNCKKVNVFLEIDSSKGPLETHSWVLTNLMKNFCQTLGSIVRSSKFVLKRASFGKLFFSKKILWKRRMKCSLDNPTEQSSLAFRKNFRSKWEKMIDLQFLFTHFPQLVSLELQEVILLILPKNVCQCVKFCGELYKFSRKRNALNSSYGQEKKSFHQPCCFLPKFRKFLMTAGKYLWSYTF